MLKRLMVGAAAALLAAGCTATRPTRSGEAGATSTGTAPPSTAPSGSTAPAGQASVYSCDQQPVAKPKTYILACGDAGLVLNQLAWSGWGRAQATATGVQTQNSCVPTCAAGSPISTGATAILSGLTAGRYTKLHVVTSKGTSDYTISTLGPVAAG